MLRISCRMSQYQVGFVLKCVFKKLFHFPQVHTYIHHRIDEKITGCDYHCPPPRPKCQKINASQKQHRTSYSSNCAWHVFIFMHDPQNKISEFNCINKANKPIMYDYVA